MGEVPWEKNSSIETSTAWNNWIPCNSLKIMYNYLILYFIIIFWFTFSSFQGSQSWYLSHSRFPWINRWGYLGKNVNHWGSEGLEYGNLFQKFKNHSQLPNTFILSSFFCSLSHHFKVRRVDIWLNTGFNGARSEVIWENSGH